MSGPKWCGACGDPSYGPCDCIEEFMEHKTQIDGFESLEVLAEQIGNLRYDALAQFLAELETKLMRDSLADSQRGRPKLSLHLHQARCFMGESRIEIERAWKICEPFMS